MKHLILIFLVSELSFRLSGSVRPEGDTDIGFEPAISVLAKALETADRLEVYEGLPNPFGENKLFESEKQVKACRQIAGEWFYAKPQEAKLEILRELQRLTEAKLFQSWRGMKFCGGFHADFAVALATGKKTLYVLFCYGCHEAKIISESKSFTADISTVDFRLTTDLNPKSF